MAHLDFLRTRIVKSPSGALHQLVVGVEVAETEIDYNRPTVLIYKDVRPFDILVADTEEMKVLDREAKMTKEDNEAVSVRRIREPGSGVLVQGKEDVTCVSAMTQESVVDVGLYSTSGDYSRPAILLDDTLKTDDPAQARSRQPFEQNHLFVRLDRIYGLVLGGGSFAGSV